MNGRCENDALDGATDVCDACGGEFCPNCLLYPNGPKKVPLCTACAIATSGIRKAAKRERLQSKSSASKRRKELRKLAAQGEAQTVVVVEDYDFGEETPAPKKKRLRRKSDAAVEAEAEAEPIEDPIESVEPTPEPVGIEDHGTSGPAAKLLEEMRANGAVGAVAYEEAQDWNFPSDFSDPDQPEPDHANFDQPDHDRPDFGSEVEDRFEAEVATDRNEPFENNYKPAHTWETLHNPDASNPFDDPSVGKSSSSSGHEQSQAEPAAPASATPSSAPGAAAAGGSLQGSPFGDDGPIPPPPQHRQPEPSLPTPGPEHRSPSPATTQAFNINDALAETLPADAAPPAPAPAPALDVPAPLVQPEPEPRKKRRHLLKAMTDPAVPVVQAEEVVQERVQDPTTDTDAAGQWIPPNLRGMVSAEDQTELPKRQRNG